MVMDKVRQILLLVLTTYSVGKLTNWLRHTLFIPIFFLNLKYGNGAKTRSPVLLLQCIYLNNSRMVVFLKLEAARLTELVKQYRN